MKKKNLTDYVEKKPEEKLVQCYIDKSLYSDVRAQLKQNNVTFKDLVEAACKKYLDESKPKAS